MKETSDKLDQATKQLQAAEAEVKKVLLDKEKSGLYYLRKYLLSHFTSLIC